MAIDQYRYVFLTCCLTLTGCQAATEWVRFDGFAVQDSVKVPALLDRTISGTLGTSVQPLDSAASVNVDVTGLSVGDIITVYTDNACLTPVGTATQTIAGVNPVTTSLSANQSYTFYAIVEDANGLKTACLPTGVTYRKIKGFTVSTTATPNAADSNTADGVCDSGSGACTLAAAVQQATQGTEETIVHVPAGTFLMTATLSVPTTSLTRPLTIRGTTGTILDGQNTVKPVAIAGTPTGTGGVTFENFVIQNGRNVAAFADGGGMSVDIYTGTATNRAVVKNCTFKNNYARDRGGALYIRGEHIDILRSKFENNTVDNSGDGIAIFFNSSMNITVDEIEVKGHTVNPTFAQGILAFNYTKDSTLKNSTFMNNTSTKSVIYTYDCDGCVFSNSTIAMNNGRGMTAGISGTQTMTLKGLTFSDNALSAPTSTFRNVRLSTTPMTTLSIFNTIMHLTNLAGKSFEKSGGTGAVVAENVIINDSSHGIGAGVTVAEPLLGALAANGGFSMTMLPGATSPAIDGGSLARCTALDQRGLPRPKSAGGVGPFCDVGAVEIQ